jgi:antitoxin ParD1/3/4
MSISFSPELEELVRKELASGKYASENELLVEAVRLLAERDRRRDELREQIQVGREQLDQGVYTEYDEASLRQYFDELQEQGRQAYESRRKST